MPTQPDTTGTTQGTQNQPTQPDTTQSVEVSELKRLTKELSAINTNAKSLLNHFDGITTQAQEALNAISTQAENKTQELTEYFNTLQNQANTTKEEFREEITNTTETKAQELETLAEDLRAGLNSLSGFDYQREENPKPNTNPTKTNAIFLNTRTLELFVCVDKTRNSNIWLGSKGGSIGGSSQLPQEGEAGFGVGVAPREIIERLGMIEMEGTNNPRHPNYGNYLDASGSVMVWIPKMYVKKTHETSAPYLGLKVEVKSTQDVGYVLPRCFINAGQEIPGLFLDKYLCSQEGLIAVSKRYGKPLSSHSVHNPYSNLGNITTFPNRLDTAYKAAKTRGANYAIPHTALYTHLADLAQAHYQRLYESGVFQRGDYSLCAWADVAPFLPKGNNNPGKLTDINDKSVVFTHDGYTTGSGLKCALTGGVSDSNLAKITHNGQKCGVVDVNGNMWELGSGYITNAQGAHLYLKENVDLKTLSSGDIAYNFSLYSTFSPSITLNNTHRFLGNGTNKIFSGESNRASRGYINDSLGIPINDSAFSNTGTDRFGKDSFSNWQVNNMAFLLKGSFHVSSWAGIFMRDFTEARAHSHDNCGFRTCLIP